MADFQEELWKDITGYEGVYQVSNMGRVKTLARQVGTAFRHDKILLQYIENGYLSVRLYLGDRRGKHRRVSRLVAEAFCENDNPAIKIFVNHKNENVMDNRAENLEWCTAKYNCNYGTRNQKLAQKMQKPIVCMKNDGTVVKTFSSIFAGGLWASGKEKGFSNVSACLCGRTSTAYGYRWRYQTGGDAECLHSAERALSEKA